MENEPFEDVFPIKNGDIPASYVSLPEGIGKSPFSIGNTSSFMVDFPASHVNFQGCIAVEPVSQRCH